MTIRPAPLNARQRCFNGLEAFVTVTGDALGRKSFQDIISKSDVTRIVKAVDSPELGRTVLNIKRTPAWGNNTHDLVRQLKRCMQQSSGTVHFYVDDCKRTDAIYRDDLAQVLTDEVTEAAREICKDSNLKLKEVLLVWQ